MTSDRLARALRRRKAQLQPNTIMINLIPSQLTPEALPQAIQRLFDGFLAENRPEPSHPAKHRVWRREDALVLQIDLPGFRKDEVKLTVREREVSLEAKVNDESEHRSHLGQRHAAWRLGPDLDPSRLEAKLADGVLEITVPKLVREDHTREVVIA